MPLSSLLHLHNANLSAELEKTISFVSDSFLQVLSANATMPGTDCAFYGCHTSRKSQISLFKILVVRAANSEHTEDLKTKAREMKNGSH